MSDVLAPRPDVAALLDENPSPNGREPDSFEARLLVDLDGAIAEKRDGVIALEAERERLTARILEARAALKRYEDTRKRLVGEPLRQGRPPGHPKLAGGEDKRVRVKPSNLSPERLARIEADIRRYAEDHDEFRQVDIRSMPGAAVKNSGAMARGFEQLRQEMGVIRIARVDGNQKWFRLTRSAVQGETREPLVGAERMVEVERVVRELGAEGEFGYDVVTARTGLSRSAASYAMGELVARGVLGEQHSTGRGGAKTFFLAKGVEA